MIRHFVGEHISVSRISVSDTKSLSEREIVRLAFETSPDSFMDFNADEWNELAAIIHMIGSILEHRARMGPTIGVTIIGDDDEQG